MQMQLAGLVRNYVLHSRTAAALVEFREQIVGESTGRTGEVWW